MRQLHRFRSGIAQQAAHLSRKRSHRLQDRGLAGDAGLGVADGLAGIGVNRLAGNLVTISLFLHRAADHDIDPFTDGHQAGVFFVERGHAGLQLRGDLAGLFAVIGVDEGSAFDSQREARLYGPIEHRIRGAVLKIGEQDGDRFVSFWRSWP